MSYSYLWEDGIAYETPGLHPSNRVFIKFSEIGRRKNGGASGTMAQEQDRAVNDPPSPAAIFGREKYRAHLRGLNLRLLQLVPPSILNPTQLRLAEHSFARGEASQGWSTTPHSCLDSRWNMASLSMDGIRIKLLDVYKPLSELRRDFQCRL
jgi:hypothetical protein